MGLPTFDDVEESLEGAAEAVHEHGRSLIPWLPDPPNCPGCGALMYATETFDPQMVEYVNAWECRACDAPDRYREDPNVPEPEPPRRGATALQEVFRD